jgi:hypothetical protein
MNFGARRNGFGAKFPRPVAFSKPWSGGGAYGGVKRLTFIPVAVSLVLVGAGFARGGDSSLADARRAQAELGAEIWSEVIRIENDTLASRYPRELHALVFELAGILWFYSDADGTQSLSLHRGRLAEEKADLAPLLRAIEPGFTRWAIVPSVAAEPIARRRALPNGCFVDSIAALRERLAHGAEIAGAQLLSYYVECEAGRAGHTVLVCETAQQIEVIDPLEPARVRRFATARGADALALARALAGESIVKARWVPLDLAAFGAVAQPGGATGGGNLGEIAVFTR